MTTRVPPSAPTSTQTPEAAAKMRESATATIPSPMLPHPSSRRARDPEVGALGTSKGWRASSGVTAIAARAGRIVAERVSSTPTTTPAMSVHAGTDRDT